MYLGEQYSIFFLGFNFHQAPPPLWPLANIKWVAADIMHGAADILHGGAIILYSMASILSNVPEILHVQHQFFEIFLSVLGGGSQTPKW